MCLSCAIESNSTERVCEVYFMRISCVWSASRRPTGYHFYLSSSELIVISYLFGGHLKLLPIHFVGYCIEFPLLLGERSDGEEGISIPKQSPNGSHQFREPLYINTLLLCMQTIEKRIENPVKQILSAILPDYLHTNWNGCSACMLKSDANVWDCKDWQPLIPLEPREKDKWTPTKYTRICKHFKWTIRHLLFESVARRLCVLFSLVRCAVQSNWYCLGSVRHDYEHKNVCTFR